MGGSKQEGRQKLGSDTPDRPLLNALLARGQEHSITTPGSMHVWVLKSQSGRQAATRKPDKPSIPKQCQPSCTKHSERQMQHSPRWLCQPHQHPLAGFMSLLSLSYTAVLGQR